MIVTNTETLEPTIVETVEEAQFILEENPDVAVLIRPKCALDKVL